MIDIIYEIVKPSHLKKLQIIQNIDKLMFQVMIFSDWILAKQVIFSSTPFCCWRKQIFEKMFPGRMNNFPLPACDDKNLGQNFEWAGIQWVKMPRFNTFSKNLNNINLKSFPTYVGIYKFERKLNKHSGER